MKVIFCDVDGVLNTPYTKGRTPDGYRGVTNDLVRNLRKIVSATGAVIVLSSDWRLIRDDPKHRKSYYYLLRKLKFAGGLSIADHTEDIRWDRRGHEIRLFLEEHPEVTDFVILDDIPFGDFGVCGLLSNLVLTNPNKGLTSKDVDRAVRILQGEYVKPCELERNFD